MRLRQLPVLLPALLLCACSSKPAGDQAGTAENVIPEAVTMTALPQETEPVPTAPVQVPHTGTFTVPQTSELAVTRYTVPVQTEEPPYRGGEGDEAHAETPEPEYFTYRFTPNGISVRLAGGTYQTLPCDLSASVGCGIEMLYQLPDCNFDGRPDLLVPVSVADSDIRYAAFCWNESLAAFEDIPVFLRNPLIHPETEQIVCLSQDSDTAAYVSVLQWENGALNEVQQISADYETLALTAGDTVTSYDTEEELTKALLEYYH